MKRSPRLIGRLLPLLIVLSCLSARAAQMEGPTVYEVEPTLAVITDDGSEAYYVDNRALIRLDLKQSISAKIDLDGGLTSKEFALAGFAPTGELIGYSKANLWVYDPANHAQRIVFRAPAKEKIRYAAVKGDATLLSVAPHDHPDDSTNETLSLLVHDLVKLTWNGKDVVKERIHTRREVLPPGAVFDSDGLLFFPMRDIYECKMDESDLDGRRCLPVSTECVFTGGSSPGTFGARSIAVSKKMIYVFVNRLGGSGPGFGVRFPKQQLPETADLFDNPDGRYRQAMTLYADSLRSMEILQTNVSDTALCASANGNHVLIGCHLLASEPGERKWFKVTNDGNPVALDLKN